MARFLMRNVLLFSLVTLCILAGKGDARPSDDAAEADEDYVNDNNYDGDGDYTDDNAPEKGNESTNNEQAYSGPAPVITTLPQNITVQPGANVWLPCETLHTTSSDFAISWYNDSLKIFTDNIKLSADPRVFRFPNNTIRITRVGPEDSANYTCEISALPVVTVVHMLHVPSPARIIEINPKKTTLMKGNSLTLACAVSGYPKPVITWTRKDKNKLMPSGEQRIEGNPIIMENINRHHEGMYECEASNGLGPSVRQSVTVHVHYAPEIHIEKETVNTAEGYESELTCTVHAEPKAVVEWFHNGVAVERSSHVELVKESGKNILRLKDTKKNDFGTYVCKAKNTIGTNEKIVKLSGMPTQPLYMKMTQPDKNGLTELLVWTIESSSPITEYELKFRKEKMDWMLSTPVVENPEGNKYTVKHELTDLAPGKYEAYVRAKNTYGWSQPSDVYQFSADDVKGDTAAKTAESSASGAKELRPTMFAVMSVLGVCAFLL